jgi:phosphoserine phosphatase RsbU/P
MRDISDLLLNVKWLVIALTILVGDACYHLIGESYTLVNIGLISFAAVSQFAPAFFGALYWRRATRWGALSCIAAGFLVWCYTLLLPSFVRSGWLQQSLLSAGPLGADWLRPEQLFGLSLGPWSNTVFWSLTVNVAAFALVSLGTRQTPLEESQAERFVVPSQSGDIPATQATVPDGVHTAARLEDLVAKFTGRDQTQMAFRAFYAEHGIHGRQRLGQTESLALSQFAERCLSGAAGPPPLRQSSKASGRSRAEGSR